jgi:hypothetical protein
MAMPIRAIAVAACVVSFVSCDRLRDQKVIGTWRAEKDGTVDELAFRPDHTVVWWLCPNEFTTPQTLISAGEWHIHGSQLDVDLKQLNSPGPAQHLTHKIVSVSTDTLLLGNPKEASLLTFHRLEMPACVAPKPGSTPYPIEPNIAGTWQVHFNTHDFKYDFAADHTAAVSARDSGEFEPMWKGTWSITGNDLILDLKADFKYGRDQKVTWSVHGFQPRCFTIRDAYGNPYIVHRFQ